MEVEYILYFLRRKGINILINIKFLGAQGNFCIIIHIVCYFALINFSCQISQGC